MKRLTVLLAAGLLLGACGGGASKEEAIDLAARSCEVKPDALHYVVDSAHSVYRGRVEYRISTFETDADPRLVVNVEYDMSSGTRRALRCMNTETREFIAR